MRRKTVGKRRRSTTPSATPSISPIPLLSTAQDDDHNATETLYNSDKNDDHQPTQLPDSIPEFEAVDSFNDGICISCNQCDGELLVCTGTDCPVSVHVSCIGSQPKFDDSGNFYCPYCWYKRALNIARQLKQKALIAKAALANFLDENQTVRKDPVEEPVVEPVQEPVNQDEFRVSDSEEKERKEHNDSDKGDVSVTGGSSVSETNDSDYKAIPVRKGNVKRRVRSCVKKSLLREQNSGGGGGGDVDEEEVTSSRSRLSKQKVQKQIPLKGGGKRKPLFWKAEEEKALEEGVLKFSKENQNIPWRKILEFGCRVFDKTRTPVDLKDKWKKMSSKKGCK